MREWVAPPLERSPVTLPYRRVATCPAVSANWYFCTRRWGHTGRHAAERLDRNVREVWEQVKE